MSPTKANGKILLCLLIGVFCWTVLKAGTTGKIAGQVVDAISGESLPGVNIVVVGTVYGAATDANGQFAILRVPPGLYTVEASMIGYAKQAFTEVKVSVDRTTTLNFDLQETMLEFGETIEVIAKRPIVQMDLTSTSATVSADKIALLPVETFEDLVALQAGVVEGHVRGGRRG